ncbi:hypothetical protein BpHYR1_007588 [Brachionus plicatilis]|uniref:Uncharacterized protein n=1 Tax=Brachionus plicatilis TaxID=10195 RepID=A0A3M7R1U0_BRAPC|nr:hypothetical protein BpHYR1_007588 [Brachionus plicatilis]
MEPTISDILSQLSNHLYACLFLFLNPDYSRIAQISTSHQLGLKLIQLKCSICVSTTLFGIRFNLRLFLAKLGPSLVNKLIIFIKTNYSSKKNLHLNGQLHKIYLNLLHQLLLLWKNAN